MFQRQRVRERGEWCVFGRRVGWEEPGALSCVRFTGRRSVDLRASWSWRWDFEIVGGRALIVRRCHGTEAFWLAGGGAEALC